MKHANIVRWTARLQRADRATAKAAAIGAMQTSALKTRGLDLPLQILRTTLWQYEGEPVFHYF